MSGSIAWEAHCHGRWQPGWIVRKQTLRRRHTAPPRRRRTSCASLTLLENRRESWGTCGRFAPHLFPGKRTLHCRAAGENPGPHNKGRARVPDEFRRSAPACASPNRWERTSTLGWSRLQPRRMARPAQRRSASRRDAASHRDAMTLPATRCRRNSEGAGAFRPRNRRPFSPALAAGILGPVKRYRPAHPNPASANTPVTNP